MSEHYTEKVQVGTKGGIESLLSGFAKAILAFTLVAVIANISVIISTKRLESLNLLFFELAVGLFLSVLLFTSADLVRHFKKINGIVFGGRLIEAKPIYKTLRVCPFCKSREIKYYRTDFHGGNPIKVDKCLACKSLFSGSQRINL
jgi:hypothetical protein